jgi:hypothetical protein
MAEFTPEQLAAFRKIRDQRIEEARAKYGEVFSDADMERIKRKAEGAEKEQAPQRERRSSLWAQITEYFRAPSVRWAALAGAAAVIILAVVLFLPPRPETIQLAALPDSERTTATALPKNFGLDLKKQRLELSEGGDRLSGKVSPLAGGSSPGVEAFTVSLAGKDSAGVEARFRGTLWLTNAAGATTIRTTRDVAGARLGGTFEILGQSTNAVNQVFVP